MRSEDDGTRYRRKKAHSPSVGLRLNRCRAHWLPRRECQLIRHSDRLTRHTVFSSFGIQCLLLCNCQETASMAVVETEVESKSLPANAYEPLKPGETYPPLIPAEARLPELTARSIGWGVFLCIVFTVASAYSGLKVGQVMESAIPISILAIGLARGCLGVLFLIPLRRYFVRDMHGLLPYPEATAITEVLVTGEKGGSQAKLLLQATAIAGVYDFFVTTFQVWKEFVNFQFVPVFRLLNDRARMVFGFDAVGFILGLGYVMGLRASTLLCAGGVLS